MRWQESLDSTRRMSPLVASLGWVAVGLAAVALTIAFGGSIGAFLDPASALLVLGGTAAVTAAGSSREALVGLRATVGRLRGGPDDDLGRIRGDLAHLATTLRRHGPRALEGELVGGNLHPLLAQGVRLFVDGVTPERLEGALTAAGERRLQARYAAIGILRRAGETAPGMGLVGTLIGLVRLLGALDRPELIGPAMAVALLTTLYGAILANGLLLPLADRLESLLAAEAANLRSAILGFVAVARGEHPDRVATITADLGAPDPALGYAFETAIFG